MSMYEEDVNQIDENAVFARGHVLHRTIELEMLINYLVTFKTKNVLNPVR